MSRLIAIHSENPQRRLLQQVADCLATGGVVVYPTDSSYALGCHIGDKDAMERIRRLRQLDDKHNFTLVCRDLSEIATYAMVDNTAYRLLRAFTPGPYTFILQATKQVPRRLQHPKRKTIGIRIPGHAIPREIIAALGEPLLSSTLLLPGEDLVMPAPHEMEQRIRKLGDPTAMMLGRLTLNPLKHIDPIGTVLVPLVLILAGGVIFGWAKPVPITVDNLRHPKRDMALVAAAGPTSNLLMALIWALIMKLALVVASVAPALAMPLTYMGAAGISINVMLMVLNLLPVPPLDGSRVVSGMLPDPMAWKFNRLEPYGLIILLGLMITGILGKVLWPPVMLVQGGLYRLLGL